MKCRALLILIGGRQVPNVLTAQYLTPDLIVPIASREAMMPGKEWEKVAPILRQLCPQGLAEPIVVDGFKLSETYEACLSLLKQHAEAEWVFNVTCATKVMSIAAYEAAIGVEKYAGGQPAGISVWYLDGFTRRVVTLAGKEPPDDLYRLSVSDYIAAYGRVARPRWAAPPPPAHIDFARALAKAPRAAMDLKRQFVNQSFKAGHTHTLSFVARPQMRELLDAALANGFIASMQVGSIATVPNRRGKFWNFTIEINGDLPGRFINGDWLEVYTWWAATEARCFDDFCCSVEIPAGGANNELDLAATRAANLLIAECKTEQDPFDVQHIYKLDAIASLVGGLFVGRLFITCQSVPANPNWKKSYDSFSEQARARQIVLVTGEQLQDLPEILRRESGASGQPTYSHI